MKVFSLKNFGHPKQQKIYSKTASWKNQRHFWSAGSYPKYIDWAERANWIFGMIYI